MNNRTTFFLFSVLIASQASFLCSMGPALAIPAKKSSITISNNTGKKFTLSYTNLLNKSVSRVVHPGTAHLPSYASPALVTYHNGVQNYYLFTPGTTAYFNTTPKPVKKGAHDRELKG